MFYQCKLDCLTAGSSSFKALESIHCAKCYFSLCPSLTFLFLSTFWFPLHGLCFLAVLRVLLCPDPLTPAHPPVSLCFILPYTVLSLPLFLLPPVSSSHGPVLCWVCRRWGSYALIGHEGMKIFSQGAEFTRLKKRMHRKHLPPKLWHPPRPTSNVSSKYQIPSPRRTSIGFRQAFQHGKRKC